MCLRRARAPPVKMRAGMCFREWQRTPCPEGLSRPLGVLASGDWLGFRNGDKTQGWVTR